MILACTNQQLLDFFEITLAVQSQGAHGDRPQLQKSKYTNFLIIARESSKFS
jgi:hypothetical protein